MSSLADTHSLIQDVAARVGPSVVGLGGGWGGGSGVVVAAGRVLTAAHAVRRPEPAVTFGDGRRATATVAGIDEDLDLAVLEVGTADAPAVPYADAAKPGLGTPVLAAANPGGRGLRVTTGFVSAGPRSFRGPRGRRIPGAIEHTAPLPRGSSGGPLLDAGGRLLGLNAIRLEGGLILAVPADEGFRRRVEALSRGEGPARPRLGIAIAPPRAARRLRRAVGLPERDGLLVREVEDGSPAVAASLARGDLIVAVAGGPADSVEALYEALDGIEAAGTLVLTVLRGADEREVAVDFGATPSGGAES